MGAFGIVDPIDKDNPTDQWIVVLIEDWLLYCNGATETFTFVRAGDEQDAKDKAERMNDL